MHFIGQILNFEDRREFPKRGTEYMHAQIHIVDALKIDENEDSEVVEFIDTYITCALPDETKYPEISNLVKKVQTQHHTNTQTLVERKKFHRIDLMPLAPHQIKPEQFVLRKRLMKP